MGSVTNRAIQNEATRRYVEEIWAERLRGEGFVCPDEKLLCWYRVVNKEIVHFICFNTNYSDIPVWLNVAWGAYPLFVHPYYIRNVNDRSTPLPFDLSEIIPIHEAGVTIKQFRDDIPAYVPAAGTCGLWLLEDRILPWLNRSQCEASCYQAHLSDRMRGKAVENGRYVGSITRQMALYTIYMENSAAYSHCLKEATDSVERYTKLCASKPNNQQFRQGLQEWSYVLHMLEGGNREEFLLNLEHRKQKTLKWLKKMGIPVLRYLPQ